MITFHNESLVQPELCRLLTLSVPENLHAPVVFHAGEIPDAGAASGMCEYPDLRIHISLLMISVWSGYSSADLWHELLRVCYHEFGHVATSWAHDYVSSNEYATHGDGWRWTEQQADEWAERRLAIVCDRDNRLGQPTRIRGYLGARLAKGSLADSIRERRFLKTGGQLTSGDMLRRLNCEPRGYSNAYRLLRAASEGIGIDYTDRAGRQHKLYNWGDGPLLAARFNFGELKTSWQACDHCGELKTSWQACHHCDEPHEGPPLPSTGRLEEWVRGVEGWGA